MSWSRIEFHPLPLHMTSSFWSFHSQFQLNHSVWNSLEKSQFYWKTEPHKFYGIRFVGWNLKMRHFWWILNIMMLLKLECWSFSSCISNQCIFLWREPRFSVTCNCQGITVFSCSLEMKGHNRCVSWELNTYLVSFFVRLWLAGSTWEKVINALKKC